MQYEKHLIRDKRFWPAFWTQFFGAFNDNVFKNAMVLLIAYKSYGVLGLGPEQMVALCGGIFILPFFLFSAIAGQVSDKYNKHKLMFYIKIWEIMVMLLGATGYYFENIHILLGALFLMGLQSTFFGPVKYSILPELINDDELIQGNALIEMGTMSSILLGTILGGTLIAIPETGRLYVAAIVIILAIIGTFFSSKIQTLNVHDDSLKVDWGLIRPTRKILKITTEVKSVFHSVLGISWFWFVGAILLSIFPVYAKNTLNCDETVVTLFLAVFSIGVGIGSFICEKLSHKHLELGLVPFGSIGMTLFTLDLFFIGQPAFVNTASEFMSIEGFLGHAVSYRILFDLLLFSVFSGFFIVPLYTFIQLRTPNNKISRVMAGNNILNALFMVSASIMLMVLFAKGATSIEVFLVIAVLNIFVSAYIYTIIPEFLWRFVCVLFTRLVYRLKVKGIDNVPDQGAAILVCNHVTFVDWLFVAAAMKRPPRFVMHYVFMKIPVMGFFFRGSKVIPIAEKHEDEGLKQQAFDKIAQELEAGELVCLFPEGVITRDGELGQFKRGIEQIISRTPVPVIPISIDGLWGTFFSRKHGKAGSKPSIIFKTLWKRIDLSIGSPVPAEKVNAQMLEDITRDMLKIK